MAVHTVEALGDFVASEELGSPPSIRMSYLDAFTHRVLTPYGQLPGGADDEREQWSLNVAELARLHDTTVVEESRITKPQAQAAAKLFQVLQDDPVLWREYLIWENEYRAGILKGKWDRIRTEEFPPTPVAWSPLSSLDWDAATQALASCIGDEELLINKNGPWTLDFSKVSLSTVQVFHRIIASGSMLELAVYIALIAALIAVGRETDSEHVRHSLILKRGPVTAELDVAAVIGFQLLAISCTKSGPGARREAKARGFEVLHRAKQLGGDGARAILICALSPSEAMALENDLRDDPGVADTLLRVWGVDTWSDFERSFTDYLRDDLGID